MHGHDATGSLLGYLAQCRYALLEALRELKQNPSHDIAIERFDDISFEDAGTPIELIQSKHHGTPSDVGDKSVDVWKTLLIWTKKVDADTSLASQTRFVFLTTASASEGSALALLRKGFETRDLEKALELLVFAAETSTNQQSAKARQAFLALDPSLRRLLVSNIWVFDRAPNIINTRQEIENELTLGVPPGQIEAYTDRLEGWWFRRVIAGLSKTEAANTALASLLGKITEIRDDFSAGSLPLDPEIEMITGAPIEADDDRCFVKQMRLVDVQGGAASGAVQDYYRAFTQRSKWAREDLLLDDEADRYDKTLADAMRREREALLDEAPCVDEVTKRQHGRRMFHWSRRHAQPLRNRHEIWLSAGSYQILSDRKLIGWHPEYEVHLGEEESSE